VKKLGWKVDKEQAPTQLQSGKIEATARTLFFGFIDDVAIRITPAGRQTRVDVRSSSRHGKHDLGRNAERVHDLFAEVKNRLNEIDKAERMQRAIALNEKRYKKAQAEKLAAEKERARQERLAKRARERRLANSGRSGSGDQSSSQSRSQSATQDAQEQNRRRRRQENSSGFGRFWEQLLR
jgi:hypothetical protein